MSIYFMSSTCVVLLTKKSINSSIKVLWIAFLCPPLPIRDGRVSILYRIQVSDYMNMLSGLCIPDRCLMPLSRAGGSYC